jgi:hypothetical protein
MHLENIPLNGICDSKNHTSPSGYANAASNIHEDGIKDRPKEDQYPLEQFYEDCIFNQETVQNIIATQDAQKVKATATQMVQAYQTMQHEQSVVLS